MLALALAVLASAFSIERISTVDPETFLLSLRFTV